MGCPKNIYMPAILSNLDWLLNVYEIILLEDAFTTILREKRV